MSTRQDIITAQRKAEARAEKIERLLPVYGALVADAAGRTEDDFHPVTDLDDAKLVRHNARLSLDGERTTITFKDRRGVTRTKETYVFWNEVADLADIPLDRYPSVDTIEALVRRLGRRVKDLRDVSIDDLFGMAAGAA